ncbi:MAG: DUF6789 family protein [Betaproteobacteria bacterium]
MTEMISIRNAIVSGFFATFVVGSILLMKNALNWFPEIHIAQTLSTLFGWPSHLIWGGVAFVLIGSIVLGLAYAWVAPRMPVHSKLIKGLAFGLVVWLMMMLVLMPAAGAGMFGLNRGPIVPAFDLIIAMVYGLILAIMYVSGSGFEDAARTNELRR